MALMFRADQIRNGLVDRHVIRDPNGHEFIFVSANRTTDLAQVLNSIFFATNTAFAYFRMPRCLRVYGSPTEMNPPRMCKQVRNNYQITTNMMTK